MKYVLPHTYNTHTHVYSETHTEKHTHRDNLSSSVSSTASQILRFPWVRSPHFWFPHWALSGRFGGELFSAEGPVEKERAGNHQEGAGGADEGEEDRIGPSGSLALCPLQMT